MISGQDADDVWADQARIAPEVSAVAMARPTRSEGLYQQCVGRGTRLFPGKSDCLVLDFVDLYQAGGHFWAFNVADAAIRVGVDSSGNVYVVGQTTSTSVPGTAGSRSRAT